MSALPPGLSARRRAFGGQLTADSLPLQSPSASLPLPPPAVPSPAPSQPPRPAHTKISLSNTPTNTPAPLSTTSQLKKKPTAKSKVHRSKQAQAGKVIAVATPIEEDDGSMCFLCAETVQVASRRSAKPLATTNFFFETIVSTGPWASVNTERVTCALCA